MTIEEAYNKIDSFLRNNLDNPDYAEYVAALDQVFNGGGSFAAGQVEEREACAKLCDSRRRTISHNGISMWSHDAASVEAGYCAEAIRKREKGENNVG